jgi:plastocyanin
MHGRRQFLKSASAIVATTAIAGCNTDAGGENAATTDPDTATTEATGTTDQATDSRAAVTADAAVAAQWNVYRARLADAAALGTAGEAEVAARTVSGVFEDFENAGGEYGAHETLEATSEDHYEGFESAVVAMREALAGGDTSTARDHHRTADDHLAAAQRSLVGDTAADALDVLAFGDRAATASALAAADRPSAAAVTANAALTVFADAAAHDALETASSDAYRTFEDALGDVLSAGQSEDATAARAAADNAVAAAIDGAYAVAGERVVGAGHVASFQARAYDAAAVARLGGPATSFAHASTLTAYRARAHDAVRLAEVGETEAAATAAIDVLEHFEGARAHEPLEEADHDAYEGFEGGVQDLQAAIQDGAGVEDALARVDENLVAGVDALATGTEAAVLEAGFFRARLADARERYRRSDPDAAAALAESLFERFERDELGVHETIEETSEALYERFEHDHLEPLPDAMRSGDDDAVAEHVDGALAALQDFQTEAASTARVSGAESAYLTARAFDAAALASTGDSGRAATVAADAMAHFEAGAGGFHESLEKADEDAYHGFEEALVGVEDAASSGGDAYAAAQTFGDRAGDAAYTVVSAAGGELGAAAAGVVRDALAAFETARVHETLEEADHDAYEGFEGALDEYASALESGGASVDGAANASLRAQFAVVGAIDSAPVDASGGGGGGEPELSGGPNVVSGVPEDADHVVDMTAVDFEPAALTVQVGDTVAWTHAGGEPHTVTAFEDELPEGADYWASGEFDSQDAAETGWENGQGAVTEGESYVRTFETTGEHGYYCIPHKSLEMVGTVVVEE